MRKIVQRLFVTLSFTGLICSVFIYISSFAHWTIDRLGWRVFALHGGIFVIGIPLAIVQRVSFSGEVRGDSYSTVDKPAWVSRIVSVCGLFFLCHFILFLLLSHGAAPKVVDGNYFLDNHGTIVRQLSYVEFWRLKAWELRIFATAWGSVYSYFVMSWWFLRRRVI